MCLPRGTGPRASVRRSEGPGAVPENLPAALPPDVVLNGLQDVADGVGPLLHRCYVTRVRSPS